MSTCPKATQPRPIPNLLHPEDFHEGGKWAARPVVGVGGGPHPGGGQLRRGGRFVVGVVGGVSLGLGQPDTTEQIHRATAGTPTNGGGKCGVGRPPLKAVRFIAPFCIRKEVRIRTQGHDDGVNFFVFSQSRFVRSWDWIDFGNFHDHLMQFKSDVPKNHFSRVYCGFEKSYTSPPH